MFIFLNKLHFLVLSHATGEITAHVTVHLNYIDKGGAAPRPAMDTPQTCEKNTSFVQDQRLLQNEPSSVQADLSGGRDPFAGSAAALREKLDKQGGKSSSLKAYRAQDDFQLQNPREAVGHAVLKSCLSGESPLQIRQQAMPNEDRKLSYNVGIEGSSAGKTTHHPTQVVHSSAISSPSIDTHPQTGKKRMTVLPPLPPVPPSAQCRNAPGAPPLPPLSPPPFPHLSKSHEKHQVSSCKLKQVHWVKVNSNQVGEQYCVVFVQNILLYIHIVRIILVV